MKNETIRAQYRQLESEICRYFGETAYRVEKRPCHGKYRGSNDYHLVFGSGRELFISLGYQHYMENLQKELAAIRYLREHQEENSFIITAALRACQSPFHAAQVEILPYDGERHLSVYAVVILTHQSGQRFVYRETGMHYCLTGRSYKGLSTCVEHLLQDSNGKMGYTRLMTNNDKLIGGTPWMSLQNSASLLSPLQ